MPSRPHRLTLAALAVVGAGILAGCGQSVLELEIGQCLNLPAGTAAAVATGQPSAPGSPTAAPEQGATAPPTDTTISTVETVPCEEPHDAEVYALPTVPGAADAPFPGADALTAVVEDECEAAFESYVGISYAASSIFSTGLTPAEGSWADGDRQVVCLLVGNDAQLTGSKRGSRE